MSSGSPSRSVSSCSSACCAAPPGAIGHATAMTEPLADLRGSSTVSTSTRSNTSCSEDGNAVLWLRSQHRRSRYRGESRPGEPRPGGGARTWTWPTSRRPNYSLSSDAYREPATPSRSSAAACSGATMFRLTPIPSLTAAARRRHVARSSMSCSKRWPGGSTGSGALGRSREAMTPRYDSGPAAPWLLVASVATLLCTLGLA